LFFLLLLPLFFGFLRTSWSAIWSTSLDAPAQFETEALMVEHGVVVGTARSSARRSEAPEIGIILRLAIIAIHTHCVSCLNALIIASVTGASPAGY